MFSNHCFARTEQPTDETKIKKEPDGDGPKELETAKGLPDWNKSQPSMDSSDFLRTIVLFSCHFRFKASNSEGGSKDSEKKESIRGIHAQEWHRFCASNSINSPIWSQPDAWRASRRGMVTMEKLPGRSMGSVGLASQGMEARTTSQSLLGQVKPIQEVQHEWLGPAEWREVGLARTGLIYPQPKDTIARLGDNIASKPIHKWLKLCCERDCRWIAT